MNERNSLGGIQSLKTVKLGKNINVDRNRRVWQAIPDFGVE